MQFELQQGWPEECSLKSQEIAYWSQLSAPLVSNDVCSIYQTLYHDCGDKKRTHSSSYMKQTRRCNRQGNRSHFRWLFKNVLSRCIPHLRVNRRCSSVLAELPVQWIKRYWKYYCSNDLILQYIRISRDAFFIATFILTLFFILVPLSLTVRG